MKLLKIVAGLLAALASAAHATEEPRFELLQRYEDFEVRQYAPYLVAEVLVAGPADEAGNQGFGILAGYIFGKNKGDRRLAMTAPVTQSAAPAKLEMTAPVTQTAAPGGFAVQFVMPAGFTLATLPEPLDARITLREVAGNKVAVIRYAGSWSQQKYGEQLEKLQRAVARQGLQTEGEPVFSRYNAPFVPTFLRRNEVWLGVK
jgi:hypothetical protein